MKEKNIGNNWYDRNEEGGRKRSEVLEHTREHEYAHNKWKAAAVVFIILAIMLAVGVVFLGIKLRDNKINNDNPNLDSSSTSTSSPNTSTDQTDENSDNTNDNYLTINEWGVKFQVPDGFASLDYNKLSDEVIAIDGTFMPVSGFGEELTLPADETGSAPGGAKVMPGFVSVNRILEAEDDGIDCTANCPIRLGVIGKYSYYVSPYIWESEVSQSVENVTNLASHSLIISLQSTLQTN